MGEAYIIFQACLNWKSRKKTMNQLQHLLHDALLGTQHVSNAAIIRRKDFQLAACTAGFDLDDDTCANIVDAFKNTSELRNEGFNFRGKNFMCVRADKSSIYAKDQKQGLVMVRTETMVAIATYTEVMFPAVCVEAMEKLRDYLREKGK